jgi:hypothetical protein
MDSRITRLSRAGSCAMIKQPKPRGKRGSLVVGRCYDPVARRGTRHLSPGGPSPHECKLEGGAISPFFGLALVSPSRKLHRHQYTCESRHFARFFQTKLTYLTVAAVYGY